MYIYIYITKRIVSRTYYYTIMFYMNSIGFPPCTFSVDDKIRMTYVYAVQKVLRNHATHMFHFTHLCMIILSLAEMNKHFFQVVRDIKHNIETILEETISMIRF